jgi:two-component system, cell cycle sensor histidine kinase and response regulator CckA
MSAKFLNGYNAQPRPMSKSAFNKVLLVEDNPGDARLLREMFNEQATNDTELSHVSCVSEAEAHLGSHAVDIILLDLGLADAQGLDALRRTHAAAPRVPLVVLTGLDDEVLAVRALQEGAQDYLIKGQIEMRGLLRAMRYAIERKNMEIQNVQLQAKLRQAEKMEALGTLAGGVAHEFNNLLLPIIVTTELILSETPEDTRHYTMLLRVIDAGSKAAEIVQRILTFGRIDLPSHDVLDVTDVLREAIGFVRTTLPSSITLNVDIDDDVGMVRGDKTQLTQVLINLATNARDAIGAGVGAVSLSLSRLDADSERPVLKAAAIHRGAYAHLTIRDTGAGMDDATMLRIFEPFFSTKGVGKGTGLGLSVTHGIVTGHGGEIQVDSKLGSGTSFSIYLPLEPRPVALAMAS